MDEVQPADSYTIETEEERLDTATATVPAYRRLATWIRIPLSSGSIGSQTIVIEPIELERALARDAAPEPETAAVHAAHRGGRP